MSPREERAGQEEWLGESLLRLERKDPPSPPGHQWNSTPAPSSPPSPLLFSILLRVELFDDLEELGIPGV